MAVFTSTIESLDTLCKSIPEWNTRLNELNGQIAQRQLELARLEEERPPTARSVRNKGSTESLRPKDGDDNPFAPHDSDKPSDVQKIPFESPRSHQNENSPARPPSSSAAARAAAVTTPPPPKAHSNPRPSPNALTRQSSQPTPPAQGRVAPAILRKRKTESLASGESNAPKYRTRSMVIVYYDKAVQTAFEDLVKFVSGSRNAMRKGKMAAKMAEMRRAAELEVEGDDDDSGSQLGGLLTSGASLKGEPRGPGVPQVAHSSKLEADDATPKLKYVSTRQMGQPREYSRPSENAGSTLNVGMLRGYRRTTDGTMDIFDSLDKGLEWCQSQCEHAAHQFLRDGECTTEIENIKMKLGQVKAGAEKEMERLRNEEAAALPRLTRLAMPEIGKSRELKSVHMRKELGAMKHLEVDDSLDMEVDDEGVDDMEIPTLVFKRSRDIGR